MERVRLLREAHQQDLINSREAERRQKELIERKRKENEVRRSALADQRSQRNQVVISATPPLRGNDPGRNRRVSSVQKPPIPKQDQIRRISPKPQNVAKNGPLRVEGRVISRSPKIPQEESPIKLPPRISAQEETPRQTPRASAQERRKRYEQLKQEKVPGQAPAVPCSGIKR